MIRTVPQSLAMTGTPKHSSVLIGGEHRLVSELQLVAGALASWVLTGSGMRFSARWVVCARTPPSSRALR